MIVFLDLPIVDLVYIEKAFCFNAKWPCWMLNVKPQSSTEHLNRLTILYILFSAVVMSIALYFAAMISLFGHGRSGNELVTISALAALATCSSLENGAHFSMIYRKESYLDSLANGRFYKSDFAL